ncbi:MutS-related protein [Saccharicrinis fermentans]|uniref:DNA mismatch repair protein MutS n=1 Tax=Saccharicrinis fermentans DSM 9555 = JCM 21142 TaxID=869213 RepID=W7YHI4_9BACT|nr:DNA mismatch repair protein MutS [Saccharicrinis fermentans]GAF03916.1 DNA mismatch repair protein MutS [Saccharicrinis fermentans DSM 9555 = JCM 21142]
MRNRRKKDLLIFGNIKDENFDFQQIEKYYRSKKQEDVLQSLSDKTCEDLDFQELFMFVDRTASKVGQQYLYHQLRSIPKQPKPWAHEEKIMDAFTEDANFRDAVRKQLAKLSKDEASLIAGLFQEAHLKPPRWFFVVPVLSLFSLLSLTLLCLSSVFVIPLVIILLVNMGIHYWNKKNLYGYIGSIPQLLQMNHVASKLFQQPLFRFMNPNLQASFQIINQVRNRMFFFQLEAKIQGDLAAVFWSLLEVMKICFLVEPLLLFGVLKRLSNKRKAIEELFMFVGQIDVLYSIASLRHGLDYYCKPQIENRDDVFSVQEMYHPLIKDCVVNSIYLHDKSVLLTGSNMSGKTSFVRSVGLNVLTGLTLNTCFAKTMITPYTRIYSAIRISDDLMNDKSYYFEEVQSIKEMIDRKDDSHHNLFLLDEIYKGTNTIERVAAGKAVLSALAVKNNKVMVSTHDMELTDMLCDQYDLYHFSETINNNNVDFDYKLKKGKIFRRNAIRILELNGYPEEIIKDAHETAQILDHSEI